MMLQETALKGVFLIQHQVFEDFRGVYINIHSIDQFTRNGIAIDFIEDDYSMSFKRVLRGIHADSKCWKLITCAYGRIYLVIVNCDESSSDFGKWISFTLTGTNGRQVLVPPKFGVAHVVISDFAVFHYKQSEYYDPKRQESYRYDDKRFGIFWPFENPILSERDERGEYVGNQRGPP